MTDIEAIKARLAEDVRCTTRSDPPSPDDGTVCNTDDIAALLADHDKLNAENERLVDLHNLRRDEWVKRLDTEIAAKETAERLLAEAQARVKGLEEGLMQLEADYCVNHTSKHVLRTARALLNPEGSQP